MEMFASLWLLYKQAVQDDNIIRLVFLPIQPEFRQASRLFKGNIFAQEYLYDTRILAQLAEFDDILTGKGCGSFFCRWRWLVKRPSDWGMTPGVIGRWTPRFSSFGWLEYGLWR